MEANNIDVAEKVPASKKLQKNDAGKLLETASRLIVSKGKKSVEFPGGKASSAAIDAMLGPTGNLRAPTLRVGDTLLVGYNEDVYRNTLT